MLVPGPCIFFRTLSTATLLPHTDRMRIAHFIHRYPPALGGAEAYFARLSRHLVRAGHEVTVFTTTAMGLPFWERRGRSLPPGTTVEDGVEVRRSPLMRFFGQRYLLKALSLIPIPSWQGWVMPCNPLAWQMRREASQSAYPFDAVHATAFPYAWPLLCARKLAHRLGVPFLLTPFIHLGDCHNPDDRTRRAFFQPALLEIALSADALFVQTEGERQALWERGCHQEKLHLQGMGVDPKQCTGGNRQQARAEWNVGEDEVVVGHLANKSEEKGTVDLLRASQLAWEAGASFRVVLAGPEMRNFRRFWRRFAAEPGRAGNEPPSARVTRLGSLTEDEKRNFYAGIDVFALPSRVDSFGLVLLEAWANGVPCVGYRAGGVAWVIHHENDGLLVPCGDVRGLSAALARLSGDSALRRQLGQTGYRRVLREYRWEDKLKVVERVLEGISSPG
jgi:glycosyltransferase involved in cell wall biosynthesis